jgi:hypothetical protein
MDGRIIAIMPADQAERRTWETLIELHRRQPRDWTLIGAQMVALHGYEHERIPPRSSRDADVLVNVRVVQGGARALSRTLEQMGFTFAGYNIEGVGHRFFLGDVSIDVLGPEGLKNDRKHDQLTTVPPARTVSVPGGRQALERSEPVQVRVGDVEGTLPRPTLLGAILVKVRAIEVDDAPDNQRLDVAFLCSLADEPRALAAQLEGKQRSWLQRQQELLHPEADAWRSLGVEGENAYRVYRILANK